MLRFRPLRSIAPVAVLAVAASLAACGSNDKLSSDQANEFNAKAKQFSASMNKLNSQAAKCSQKASSGNVNQVADCFAGIFDDISGNFEEISTYVAGLSGDVEGECSTRLKTVSTSLGDVSDQFSGAAKDFRGGDVKDINSKLNNRKLNAIGPELSAAAKACT